MHSFDTLWHPGGRSLPRLPHDGWGRGKSPSVATPQAHPAPQPPAPGQRRTARAWGIDRSAAQEPRRQSQGATASPGADTLRNPRHVLARVALLLGVLCVGLLGAPQPSRGASASVSAAPQTDGSVKATATGSFGSCVGNGSITLYLNGSIRCVAVGNGSATCTKLEDRGQLHGTHVFSVLASDCLGTATENVTLTLDNTPTVAVTAPSGVVSGPFNIKGTATFKPTLNPIKGYIYSYIDNRDTDVTKICTTETCDFSYEDLLGRRYEIGHGGYTVKLIASGRGASASAEQTFRVDNTPSVAVTTPTGVVLSPFHIEGTATFKPTLNPIKGYIYSYIDNRDTYVTKICTTESCDFSYNALIGHPYPLPPGGPPHTVKLTASGYGASASDEQPFTVASCTDADLDGHFAIDAVECPPPLGDDCNDTDGDIYPGALEQCNDKDNNCNGVAAESACDTVCLLPFGSSLNVASGALEYDQELLAPSGAALALPLTLHYHSLDRVGGALGLGWMHSYQTLLRLRPDGSVIRRDGLTGRQRLYQPATGGYAAQPGDYATLSRDASGWTLVEKDGSRARFSTAGRLLFLADRNDNRITLTYTQGLLSTVEDAAGRATGFTYTAQNRLATITDPNGNLHTFTYVAGRLTTVSSRDTLLTTRT